MSHDSHKLNGVVYNIPLFAEEITENSATGNPTRASKDIGRVLYEKLVEHLTDFVIKIEKLDD